MVADGAGAKILRMSRVVDHAPRLRMAVPLSLRGAAIMPGAALAVHQLRYRLAFGSRSGHELAVQGHAYLSSLTPWIVLVAALALGASLGRLAQRVQRGDGAARPRHATLRIWLVCALVLVAIYAGQELLEGLFATGHPVGLTGIFGDGGWWALPAAALIGAVLALAMRSADALAVALARPRAPRLSRRNAVASSWATEPARWMLRPLARAAAGRAPPALVATSA
jgi:hypothetical protein